MTNQRDNMPNHLRRLPFFQDTKRDAGLDWKQLKSDLEELSPRQLELVLDLVHQIKDINSGNEHIENSSKPATDTTAK